jgi:putative Mg2+ transporter-C (MgtC) family protein
VAAQIVTGVGFLGAGAIFRSGVSVTGLTTAASLWVTAAVGTACGIGYLGPAIGVAGGAVASLTALRAVKEIIRRHHITDHEEITLNADGTAELRSLMEAVGASPVHVEHITIRTEEEGGARQIVLVVQATDKLKVRQLVEDLSVVRGVVAVEWAGQ